MRVSAVLLLFHSVVPQCCFKVFPVCMDSMTLMSSSMQGSIRGCLL